MNENFSLPPVSPLGPGGQENRPPLQGGGAEGAGYKLWKAGKQITLLSIKIELFDRRALSSLNRKFIFGNECFGQQKAGHEPDGDS